MSSLMALIRERFRFTLWPTLFMIPALIFILGLGVWQLERLVWKTNLIAERSSALAAPATPVPMTLDQARPLDFHRVVATGRFDNAHELYIGAFDGRGVEGFQIVTPLHLEDGHILLVNRGFVPAIRKDPARRAEGQIEGETSVEGILRLAVIPTGWLVPKNQPGDNFWIYVDIPAMTETLKLDNVLPYYVEAGPAPNPGGFPIGGQTRIALPNDHLQYALTWFSFAVTLIVIYLIYHYRRPEQDKPPT
ncbi:MAG TPA: SURF1 family protein [Aliidongia sp.]|nr:SURF1 family protein [Aliidongia sp.]